MRISAHFGKKSIEFFEIYGVSARPMGELNRRGKFADKGGGDQIFAILLRTSFMDGPLHIKVSY